MSKSQLGRQANLNSPTSPQLPNVPKSKGESPRMNNNRIVVSARDQKDVQIGEPKGNIGIGDPTVKNTGCEYVLSSPDLTNRFIYYLIIYPSKTDTPVRNTQSRERQAKSSTGNSTDNEASQSLNISLNEETAAKQKSERRREKGKDNAAKIAGDKVEIVVVMDDAVQKFPATVIKVNPDDTYDVRYETGHIGHNIEPHTVKFAKNSFESAGIVGEIIEVAVFLNGNVERFPGNINSVNSDGTYDVRYFNGQLGRGIQHNSIIFIERSPRKYSKAQRAKLTEIPGQVGEIIEVVVDFDGIIERFPANIDAVNDDGSYNVRYSNGKLGRGVHHSSIKFLERGGLTGSDSSPANIGQNQRKVLPKDSIVVARTGSADVARAQPTPNSREFLPGERVFSRPDEHR